MLTTWLFALSLVEILPAHTQYAIKQKNNIIRDGLRVHGGRNAGEDEFCYILSLEHLIDETMEKYKKLFEKGYRALRTCTCSLVSPTWVLTAAHCTTFKKDNLIVRYGDVTTRFDDRTCRYSKVLRIETNPMSSFVDLALIMTEQISVNEIGRLSAIQHTALYGLPVQFAGYGMVDTKNNINIDNETLQVGEGGVIPCNNKLLKIKIPFLCVTPKCSKLNQSVLPGDSGGPLLYDGQIVAVASAIIHNKYDLNHVDMLYTPISPYMTWMKKVVLSN